MLKDASICRWRPYLLSSRRECEAKEGRESLLRLTRLYQGNPHACSLTQLPILGNMRQWTVPNLKNGDWRQTSSNEQVQSTSMSLSTLITIYLFIHRHCINVVQSDELNYAELPDTPTPKLKCRRPARDVTNFFGVEKRSQFFIVPLK